MARALLFLLLVPAALPAQPKLPEMEVRLADGSKINVTVLDAGIPIQTPHGRLVVPLAEVRRIEFTARLSEDVRKQINAAIAELGRPEVERRDAAADALIKIGKVAYPAVLKACKSPNRELAISAKRLRERFGDEFAEQRLPVHDFDVIHTDDSKIAGTIEVAEVRVRGAQFGEKALRVSDLASAFAPGSAPPEEKPAGVAADPGNLTNLAQQTGKSFLFTVTGNNNGSVYGTDLYTTDSTLATACVHAGLLKVGEQGTIRVTILPGQNAYAATTRNGITSYAWGAYSASYKVARVGQPK